ncbi:uroporphyrinogen-III synthase [Oscillatoriales cyanobacterium LEGE 11467]|uniref:Uroporphyrinogen-III synthase n=1 Tax=Zarconia navalis LEGE 11467 TaxID=1828826 RepID=A0A928ZA82_9CYAN|nr:uroporphyrinogen-III synthase [Zarconia navalis]MBE9042564.1 uroporphyrinogen-III synthase [Zarconia navalis LEGE 11467]
MSHPHRLTPSHQLPLWGKRILITAPRTYASRLAQQIVDIGGLPILMPTIETCWLEDYTDLDRALQQLDRFNWIAFTSRNGIDAVAERLDRLGLSPSALTNCRSIAIGRDASRLTELGIRADMVPTEPSPHGIAMELSGVADIASQSILVPVPQVVDLREPNIVPNFIAALENLGMNVTRVPAYTTRRSLPNRYEIELNLVCQGQIDAIAFSSSAEIESFIRTIDSPHDYAGCAIACFGPYTAANAKRLGMQVAIVSEDYSSFAGFARSMAEFFAPSDGRNP